ncbi:MAG TPA: hypothetical protein P5277_00075 [Candidatus Paceibacterota bacterium]|nr:hypothetical protein [Candidatus Paceibacterota bacterium]
MTKTKIDSKQLAVLIGVVIVVGLVAGIIGSSVGNTLTGKVTLSNNAAGTGTYRIRPEGTNADTWLPYSDGNVYLTSNGAKSGAGFVLRKWLNGSSYSNLMTIDKWGNMTVSGNLKVNGEIDGVKKSIYLKPCTFFPEDSSGWKVCSCNGQDKVISGFGVNCQGLNSGCDRIMIGTAYNRLQFYYNGETVANVFINCIK